jgi:hypothetical protein
MRFLRLISLVLIFLLVGLVAAQEDLSWLTALLPTGDDINIEKQLLQGNIEIASNGQVVDESFSAENAWDEIQDRDGYRLIRDGRYEMLLRTSSAIYTGLSVSQYDDTVITVDSIHLSEELNDGYGLVCRANGWENSYHFYISGDGYYRIAVYENGAARGLTDWTASTLINQGVNASNSMTAVCVKDYLALYINASLAAEVRDSTYESGAIGMVVILFTPESEVHIGFDNLRVWEADTDAPRVSNNDASPTAAATEVVNNIDEQHAATERRIGTGAEDLELGDLAFSDSFDTADNWQEILSDTGAMDIENGFLRAFSAGAGTQPVILFGNQRFGDVVIEVDTSFVEGAVNNAFSLICRGSETASTMGYYFNISSDGFYWVWASDGERFRSVVELDRSLAINLEAANHITAVCVGDYFAFYANDTLLSEFYDDLYTEGTVGMMVHSYEGPSEIAFDNLYVWEAQADN